MFLIFIYNYCTLYFAVFAELNITPTIVSVNCSYSRHAEQIDVII